MCCMKVIEGYLPSQAIVDTIFEKEGKVWKMNSG